MSYVLEGPKEFERLEQQAALDAYCPADELRDVLGGLDAAAPLRMLDAGCGSGAATRLLAGRFPLAEVVGCDISPERVQAARDLAQSSHARFFVHDLTQPLAAPGYHFITCRYVLEHLPAQVQPHVVHTLAAATAPGGMVCLVDADGLMLNHYPTTPFIREMFAAIEGAGPDFHVGRRLPTLLRKAGLVNVAWRIITPDFKGHNLESERRLMEQRFEQAHAFLTRIIGAPNTERFRKEYLAAISHPDTVLFFNKFIVTGTRPL